MKGGVATNTFDEIYTAYYPYVHRFLLRLCNGNNYIAGDLTQETFYQAYKSIRRFEGRCRIETWLCSIAQNVYYAYLKKEKKRKELESTRYAIDNSVYFIQEEHHLEYDIVVILAQFSPVTAKVLSYRLFHEVPYCEIASTLGISESSAKVIYYRGRIELKSILKKEYGYEI